MGYKMLQIKLPTLYQDEDIRKAIRKQVGELDFSFEIEKKSLDARKKNDIHWQVSLVVSSNKLKGGDPIVSEPLPIPFKKRTEKVIVIGSGPAGFFSAHVLQLAGFQVTIIERGSEVEQRTKAIHLLESTGAFSTQNNYAFGEGGAGTFSDGKLTSRSKHISDERRFILSEYVKAGAPEEILYMAHPHVGTDNLKLVVANLRRQFMENGGQFLFNTQLEKISVKGHQVDKIGCNTGELEADHIVLATGHSAYDTYRMLINNGVQFGTKNFAIGHRIEHPQKLINLAQWGKESLPGVKAAEYRLATRTKSDLPVYTFCMCPGGQVVPAAAFEQKSVVNGMSHYHRNGPYSNAGCVVGVHPDDLLGHKGSALEILDWMDQLEERYYRFNNGYVIPTTRAVDYMKKKESKEAGRSSYLLGMQLAPLFNMIPSFVSNALAEGLADFSRKLAGFETGLLMGLESKTSSPIQVAREKDGLCTGFTNLYFVGEGSGYAGGIISSAADGVKCALALSNK
ncbi:MAG: FAD-dependent oxidoreductase [Bacteroidetes bacterium CG18_big_fil_WC_8_21_14_2_50_41_14]|nr:MAG: FAD-dependent oxidoreductase [Bacteroidetes bacterium CG18_big_fil_WC_8_21_14_2_50_41_14]PJB59139.1 MAG: FAD-dependent oxidoreductase [Bacteroidetes bacterium CG_4_9_14_3_um_filter_41_19]